MTVEDAALRQLVQFAVDSLASPDLKQLQAQVRAIRSFELTAPRIWDIELGPTPRTLIADGPLPSTVSYRSAVMDPAGEVLVWMENGMLQSLELPWYTDQMPSDLPSIDQLSVDS